MKEFVNPLSAKMADGNEAYTNSTFNVQFLKTNSGKKGEGMPVVRNSQFYFREGFCWTDINSTFLKARLKSKGIFDVVSMSLFTNVSIPNLYYVCLINTDLISYYVDNFVNNTSHFQINDARQLPIVIPTGQQLSEFENLFYKAVNLKKSNDSTLELKVLEKDLEKMILNLYTI